MIKFRLQTKEDCEKAFSVVRKVIHEWDPYSLISGGAPKNEFDVEIQKVVTRIRQIQSSEDAARVISKVFGCAFEAEQFTLDKCREPGAQLFHQLVFEDILYEEE